MSCPAACDREHAVAIIIQPVADLVGRVDRAKTGLIAVHADAGAQLAFTLILPAGIASFGKGLIHLLIAVVVQPVTDFGGWLDRVHTGWRALDASQATQLAGANV